MNFANGFQTTITDSGGITSGGATLTLASATGEPAFPYLATIVAESTNTSEVISVNSVSSGLVRNITRGVELYLGNGASAHSSGAQIWATVTAAELSTMWWNAKAFGVKGDNSTDDTTAINNFLSTVSASAGATAFFPGDSTYLMTADLNVPSNITICGEGESTIFKPKSGGTNVANAFNLNNVSGVRLFDFAIDGNKANINQTGSGATYTTKQGIYINGGSHDIVVERLYIHDTFAGGVLFDNASVLIIANNRFTNCGDNAIFARPSPSTPWTAPSYFMVMGNKVSGGSYSGIGIIKATDFTVVGNESYSNGPTSGQGSGIVVEGSTNFTVSGNQVHDNGVNGVDVRYSNEGSGANVASANGTVSGNQSYNNGYGSGDGNAGGFVTEGADNIVFQGNQSNHDEFGLNIGSGNSLDPTNITTHGNRVNVPNLVGVKFFTGSTAVNLISDGDTVLASGSDCLSANCQVTVKNPHFTGPTGSSKENLHFLSGSSGSRVLGGTLRDPIDNCVLVDSGVTDIRVRGTVINKGAGSGTRALYESNTSGAGTVIENCEMTGFSAQSFVFNNANSLARNNTTDQAGYYDHNSGSATITATTSVAVTHNLWTTPTRVEVTPTGDPGSGIRWWVSAKGATTFTITVSSSTTVTFDWRAYTWDL